jgi:DNA-directed RNA polymerase specialized sigma24 family protein
LDDPLERYARAGAEQAAAEQLVSYLTDLRARCLAELHVDGWSYARIAGSTGLSRARVQQLVERGRDVVAD